MKKIFFLLALNCLIFADDSNYRTLKGEYKYMPFETNQEHCYCNASGSDVINQENLIPFEVSLNKEISQSIIDAKNIDTILKNEWVHSLAYDTNSVGKYINFSPMILQESKKVTELNRKKTNKICVDLDLEINTINSYIVSVELELMELKKRITE